jgi:hypothetical protein
MSSPLSVDVFVPRIAEAGQIGEQVCTIGKVKR